MRRRRKTKHAIHAYVMMTNHVHILVASNEYSINHMMRILEGGINHIYRRTGTLWDGRYKASLVDSEAYFLTCMRYTELNPVRANMVEHPGDCRWLSDGHNANGKPGVLIQTHPLYNKPGKEVHDRQAAYRELFQTHLNPDQIHEIRNALSQELVLGGDDFKDKLECLTKRQARSGQPGRPRVEEADAIYYVM